MSALWAETRVPVHAFRSTAGTRTKGHLVHLSGRYEKHARLDDAWRDVVIVEKLL